MQRFLTLSLFFFLTFSVNAQFFLAGAHINSSISTAKLRNEVGSVFLPSISGVFLYEFRNTPLQVGLEFGYGMYGSKLEKRTDLFQGSNDELRLRRNNNMITGMVTMRYLPLLNTKLTPFLEAQFGANYLYTRYKIRENIDDEAFEVATEHKDWTLAYRLGAGLQIPLEFWDHSTKLEFKTTYQNSNSFRFLTKGDVNYLPDEGVFEYNFQRAPLQLVTFSLGIIIYDLFY